MEDRNEDSSSPTALPGTSFFEQALVLLKLPYEEPSIEYIELLNLAVSLVSVFASQNHEAYLSLIDILLIFLESKEDRIHVRGHECQSLQLAQNSSTRPADILWRGAGAQKASMLDSILPRQDDQQRARHDPVLSAWPDQA